MTIHLMQEDKQQFSPKEMMGQAEQFALSKTSKPFRLTFGLAIMAGLFIGLAFTFYTTVTTDAAMLGWGLSHLVGGLAFSLGLIFIVVCGGELFTSTVLSLISLFNRAITAKRMFATWATVYAGNFIGALFLVGLLMMAQMYNADHGHWGINALNIAQHKIHHSPLQAFSLGVLCNMLVCLAMWMTLSTQNTAVKAGLVVLPVALFVSSGFEHCIANMFMVPLGILIHQFAPIEFWAAQGIDAAFYADLTWSNFFVNNLLPVTLGNVVGGGVVIGLGYRLIFSEKQKKSEVKLKAPQNTHPLPLVTDKVFIMNLSNISIDSVMDTQPVTLNSKLVLTEAIDVLNHADVDFAPVVDDSNTLVGFISTHDILVELWCRDYSNVETVTVESIMKTDVQTVAPDENLRELAEYMSVDQQKLFPVTSMGYATSMTFASLSGRAKAISVNRPHQYPVVVNDKLVGMITRNHVLGAIAQLMQSANQPQVVEQYIA